MNRFWIKIRWILAGILLVTIITHIVVKVISKSTIQRIVSQDGRVLELGGITQGSKNFLMSKTFLHLNPQCPPWRRFLYRMPSTMQRIFLRQIYKNANADIVLSPTDDLLIWLYSPTVDSADWTAGSRKYLVRCVGVDLREYGQNYEIPLSTFRLRSGHMSCVFPLRSADFKDAIGFHVYWVDQIGFQAPADNSNPSTFEWDRPNAIFKSLSGVPKSEAILRTNFIGSFNKF